ncbi:MAG TPA: DUF3618 domain-containing protein [Burkholderiales bacterium]|jgi:hypothetical protein|nr:DUF3618 domain-containing protein [Burkholderiales bacterium]
MSLDQMRRPEEIEADLDRLRAKMDATLDEIEYRLTPRQLLRDGIDSMARIDATKYIVGLAGLTRSHPLPTALAGASLAGLIAARRRLRPQPPVDAKSTGFFSSWLDVAMEKLLGTRQAISESAGSARTKLASATSRGAERASDIAGSARDQLRRAGSGVQTLARERPLTAGAVGLAIAIAVAASIPYLRRKLH